MINQTDTYIDNHHKYMNVQAKVVFTLVEARNTNLPFGAIAADGQIRVSCKYKYWIAADGQILVSCATVEDTKIMSHVTANHFIGSINNITKKSKKRWIQVFANSSAFCCKNLVCKA